MNKERIKKTLAGVGIAGLITSVSMLTGCKKAESDAGAGGAAQDTTAAAKASCGAGSCGAAKDSTAAAADTAKASCGAGSCGQKADSTQTSCGQ